MARYYRDRLGTQKSHNVFAKRCGEYGLDKPEQGKIIQMALWQSDKPIVALSSLTLRARKNPKCRFTSIAHLISEDFLKRCFKELKKDRAPGIDGVTYKEYEVNLEDNIKDLVRRGLAPDGHYLFVLDGSKALRKAVEQVFGEKASVQRCQIHKRRNVRDHLPVSLQAEADRRLKSAYGMASYQEAKNSLEETLRWLRNKSPSAARSLVEGMEETLTLHRLGVPEVLRRSLSSTNLIESPFATMRHLVRNVKRWRNEGQVQRWAGTMLIEAEKRFRKVKGYRVLPMLIAALEKKLDREVKIA